MTVISIALSVAIAAVWVATIAWARNRSADSDLGCVSEQWIAEHRL